MVTIEQLFRQAQRAGAAEIYLMEMLDAKQAAQYRET